MSHCTFCFRHKAAIEAVKADTDGTSTQAEQIASGAACSYGFGHELQVEVKPKPTPKIDKQLCTLCGLHKRNPASATNGCSHHYEV